MVTGAVVLYIGWKILQSPDQALQFAFNGLSVGAIYALLAMGFSFVYSTVWFFDLYYGAAAAVGAYGVFYLRAPGSFGGQFAVGNPFVDIVFGLVTAGVVAWALHTAFYARLRGRINLKVLRGGILLLALVAGFYTWLVLSNPGQLNVYLSPAVGLFAAVVVSRIIYLLAKKVRREAGGISILVISLVPGALLGAYSAVAAASIPEAHLYLSWVVSCLMAGVVGLALYRGLYVYVRARARSPLIMLVASLGVLLALTALTTIVFQSAPRPLPPPLGSDPISIGGATIKGFNLFTIAMAVVGFFSLLLLLYRTTLGMAIRAVGDDEEVSKVVGINTTVVIAIVFFIGAIFAALAGLLSGHDTAIQPRMGLLLLLKGWIASVVGGIGNLYGAIVGGFTLGLIEQFGIWDLAGEWKDVIAFAVLILFLAFWPNGLIPRK